MQGDSIVAEHPVLILTQLLQKAEPGSTIGKVISLKLPSSLALLRITSWLYSSGARLPFPIADLKSERHLTSFSLFAGKAGRE